jgi:hypothetical protein
MIKICKQIGIMHEEIPKLILDRKEYHALKVANGKSKHAGGYGECSRDLRTIFVDAKLRYYQRKTYRRNKLSGSNTPNEDKPEYIYRVHKHSTTEWKRVKARYRDKLHILVHELVHYRFKYLRHGRKFEDRIKEILQGKEFPEKKLYP